MKRNDRNNRLLDDDNRDLFVSCWGGAYAGRNNNVGGDRMRMIEIPIKRREPVMRWIPCSERLPKKEYKEQRRGVYLTTNAYGVVGTTKYEFDGDFGFVGWGTNIPSDIRIIAWMPLPEAYKGEEE